MFASRGIVRKAGDSKSFTKQRPLAEAITPFFTKDSRRSSGDLAESLDKSKALKTLAVDKPPLYRVIMVSYLTKAPLIKDLLGFYYENFDQLCIRERGKVLHMLASSSTVSSSMGEEERYVRSYFGRPLHQLSVLYWKAIKQLCIYRMNCIYLVTFYKYLSRLLVGWRQT